ncbi:endolytic transglycosylase MltG [bacterium]|nr:endolytic transglycosylase MltG [bacterium]
MTAQKFNIYRFFFLVGRLSIYLIPFILSILLTAAFMRATLYEPANPKSQEIFSFIVERGSSVKKVGQELVQQGLVKKTWTFPLIYRMHGQQQKIQAGEYRISPSMTPLEILEKFIEGDVVYYGVTIPEGATIKDLPELLERTTLVSKDQAKNAIYNNKLMLKYGITSNSFEGYIFPDTYRFTRPTTAEEIITKAIETGKGKITNEMASRWIDLGLIYHQILTLASIIEKEAGNQQEKPKISSVFHNRLRIGMPLQADPTVIYGLPNFNGNLTKADLQTPGPYNTYLNTGLPPTPICNPGLESIKAALYPEDTEYLYFVADGSGGHKFSATLKEHNKAVQEYLRILRGDNSPTPVEQEQEKEKKEPEKKPEVVLQEAPTKKPIAPIITAPSKKPALSQIDPIKKSPGPAGNLPPAPAQGPSIEDVLRAQ